MKTALTIAACAFILSTNAHGEEMKRELAALSMVETSGGKNLHHPLIISGMHAGTRAGGSFGIMPLTGKEVITRSPAMMERFGELVEVSHDEFTEALNEDSKFDRTLARYMWSELRKVRSADEAACAWYRGPYSARCRDAEQLKDDPYVIQFEQYLKGSLSHVGP